MYYVASHDRPTIDTSRVTTTGIVEQVARVISSRNTGVMGCARRWMLRYTYRWQSCCNACSAVYSGITGCRSSINTRAPKDSPSIYTRWVGGGGGRGAVGLESSDSPNPASQAKMVVAKRVKSKPKVKICVILPEDRVHSFACLFKLVQKVQLAILVSNYPQHEHSDNINHSGVCTVRLNTYPTPTATNSCAHLLPPPRSLNIITDRTPNGRGVRLDSPNTVSQTKLIVSDTDKVKAISRSIYPSSPRVLISFICLYTEGALLAPI